LPQTIACPACGSTALRRFYEVAGLPANTLKLFDTRDLARAASRGMVELGLCEGCGFITNLRFEPSLVDYTEDYEGSQASSPTFAAYHRSLAMDLVARYQLAGATVLEIGCGKGEFLEVLLEAGAGRAIGFDPGYRPRPCLGRDARLEVSTALFTASTAAIECGLVCCKMTLEHVQDALGFVRALRRWIGERDIPVFFLLPEISEALASAAFWEVQYEHCSYFTLASLGAVFARAGFGVTRLELSYGGQFAAIEARPGPGDARVAAGELARIGRLADGFAVAAPRMRELWDQRLRHYAAAGERVALWGGGAKAVGLLAALDLGSEVGCVVDINPGRQGRYVPGTGQPIVAPEYLCRYLPDRVVVMNPIYRPEIERVIAELGLAPTVIAMDEAAAVA
jgi:hypothetical protein